ncbi:MAG: hypothetical protein II213_01605 [Lachnospiraceae bacterium]|nr:hypothetical protein [Lachnospiraceae bacterium]MBQ2565174.1 hypothetical protein [Oscillospiraceae bacterium]
MNENDIPVYLFTGFLESGKTKFIQETLCDERFNKGEKTLLLVCEEGVEEYEPDEFSGENVFIKIVEEESELSEELLRSFIKETDAERVVVEYNGMWMLDSLYQAMPEEWVVYQEFMFADATTFLTYNQNMRQLTYDKLKSCELVVFNRFTREMDKMPYHKIVRGASRRADIAYEYAPDDVEYDDIEDPLPFDINAPVIEIGVNDYAIWYRDLTENPSNYEGKTIKVLCRALTRKKLPSKTFIVGRHVMTCCIEDTQFAALVCQWDQASKVINDSWVTLTAKIHYKFHVAYKQKGPVLTCIELEPAEAPENSIATFF